MALFGFLSSKLLIPILRCSWRSDPSQPEILAEDRAGETLKGWPPKSMNTNSTTQLAVFRLGLLGLISALTFLLQPTQAGEFIVNQRDPAASDRNPGSRTKPMKTISAAVSKVHAGDRVIIHAGEYRETVIVTASGTNEAPIVIEAAPGETVIIKGSDVISGWTLDHDAIWKARLPKLPSRSTDTNDASFWRANEIHRVFIRDGILLDALHLHRVSAKDRLQPGNFFHDIADSTLYVWLPDSGDPNKAKVETAVRGAWMNIMGSYVIVRRLEMRHASTLAISSWPACNIHGEGVRLEDCAMTWGDFVGVSLMGNRNSLVRCTVACNGDAGMGGSGEGHLIEACRVIYNNIDRYDPSWHCGGAKLIPKFNKGRIVGNEFAYNIGPGLWLDGSCNDNRIERNFCHDNEGPGIMVEISARNLVLNNISTANRNSLAADYLIPDPEADKRGQHNIFLGRKLNERTQSTLIYQGGGGLGIFISSAPGSRVYNNTCYLNEGGGITVEGPLREAAGGPMSTHDCRVLNNISVYNKGPQLVVRKNGIDPDTAGNLSDHNLLLAIGGIVAKNGWAGATAFSVAEWQRVSNQDTHSREGDPRFAMSTMGDFRLLEGSPALGAGQALPGVKDDFFGRARPAGDVSIGAAEKSSFDYPRPRLW
jgi:parallel beta-helix repeat protein